MKYSLAEIGRKDLPILLNLYKRNDLKHYIAYTTIENYIRWIEQDVNDKNVKFFCLNGDFSDGTFVVTDWRTAYTDTLNASHENLFRLLQLLDFSNGFTILNIRTEIGDVVERVLKNANVEIDCEFTSFLYHLAKEQALNFDVQPSKGIELKPLTNIKDIKKLNALWPYGNEHSLKGFKRIAKYNVTIGAFKGENLVAWIVRLPNGLLGALQTDEKYFGNGYGSLVTKMLTKQIAEMGFDIFAEINKPNIPSQSLFGKLGFKPISDVRWIRTKINHPAKDECFS